MKRNVFTILLCFTGLIAMAQTPRLSGNATISVITCGPYQGELYSAFGHSAFRVYDPLQGIDDAYNYGIFDFDQPNFYLNFTRGHLYYKLAAYEFRRFLPGYIYHNRYVHEQVLNLTPAQKQKMFEYLQWNTRPENETYMYDYFYNNCATKMRDVVITALGDSVKFDGSYVTTDYTIRDLTDIYLKQQPWGDLGIDICLGMPMDKKAAPLEYMFLPDYVESGFNHATNTINGASVPLVARTNSLYETRDQQPEGRLPHPAIVFSVLAVLALVLSGWDFKRKKLTMWFDGILFGVTGLIGVLLFILWVATDHKAAANNLNILWAFPLNIIAVIAFVRQPKWLTKYFFGIAILSALLLLTLPILPQALNYSLIPVIITIMVRALTQYRIRKLAVK